MLPKEDARGELPKVIKRRKPTKKFSKAMKSATATRGKNFSLPFEKLIEREEAWLLKREQA